MFWKNKDLKIKSRIKKVLAEVKNIMMELETSSGSDNNEHNKHHKYTLDEAYIIVWIAWKVLTDFAKKASS